MGIMQHNCLACDSACIAPPGAQGQAVIGPVLAVAAASNTGTRPVAISTGAWAVPLESMGIGRNTAGG